MSNKEEVKKVSTKVMEANCNLHEDTLNHSHSTESLYVLDLGGYNCTFLVPKRQMSSVLNALDSIVKVTVRTMDLQRDYRKKARYETVITEDSKTVLSIQSYSKGSIFRIESDDLIEGMTEDFRSLRQRYDEELTAREIEEKTFNEEKEVVNK